jgi:hypothetical protein
VDRNEGHILDGIRMECLRVAAGREVDGVNAEQVTGTVIVQRKIRVSNFIVNSARGLLEVMPLLAILLQRSFLLLFVDG